MNYSNLIKELNEATSFDLYRLYSAIGRMFDDSNRLLAIKKSIRPGTQLEYFDNTENRAIKATVIKLLPTRVLIENLHDQKRWRIRYYTINIYHVDTGIIEKATQQGLGRNEVSVGDLVGFMDRNNLDRYGKVIRLNQKTVTLACDDGQWRVAYRFLFNVLTPQFDQLTNGEQTVEYAKHDNQSPVNATPPLSASNVIPIENQDSKMGRNAPCPCGSGKKYKKCCLGRENLNKLG